MGFKGLFEEESLNEQEIIVNKLRDFILESDLEMGDRLPAERKLCEQLGVSRSQVREAIKKLEFYGMLKTLPQSGTVISSLGVAGINGMITDVLRLDNPDFMSLVETRIILESNAVSLAALRRTEQDITELQIAVRAYADKAQGGLNAVEEDLAFHLKIAQASGNSVVNTLMQIVAPEIINNFHKYHVCDKKQTMQGVNEHQAILDAIVKQDVVAARASLKTHFSNLYQYCKSDFSLNKFDELIVDVK